MENLIKMINFDELALIFLNCIEKAVSPHNLELVRQAFKGDSSKVLELIINIDEARRLRPAREAKAEMQPFEVPEWLE